MHARPAANFAKDREALFALFAQFAASSSGVAA